MIQVAVAINDTDQVLVPLIVSLFTWSKSYHVELVFSDGQSLVCDPKGLRYETRTYDHYQWLLMPIPSITAAQETEIRQWCDKQVESRPDYDWAGAIFGGIVKSLGKRNGKWFCSELVRAALKKYIPTLSNRNTKIRWWSPEKVWYYVSMYLAETDQIPFKSKAP